MPAKISTMARYQTTTPTLANQGAMELQVTDRGNLKVELWNAGTAATLATGADGSSNTINAHRVAAFQIKYNGTTWDRDRKPNTTSRIASSAATTNATSAKASAGDVHTICAHNTSASAKFLKLYNKASAPVVGTDTPVFTFVLPATSNFCVNLGGQYFSTGIAYALTGLVADSDTTALAAGDVVALQIAYA